MKKSIALSAVLCVCLHAEIFTLGVVEVTAKDEGVSTPNVSVVNKKTIQLNNAKTVSDIAKLTPGVSLRGGAYARNETSISIRGLSSTQIPRLYRRYWPQWNKESIYFLSNTDFNNWYVKSKAYYDRFKNSLHNMSDSNFNQSAPGKKGFKSKYNDYTYGFGLEVGANIGENNILKFAPSYKRDVHRESDIGVPVQRYEDETLSLALEHTYFFSDRTNLTTGISYDSRKAIKAEHYGIPA